MLIVAAVVLNSCVCGMLMRPLEPPKKKRRPRAKNILDRLKERASRNRGRKDSECSKCALGVHDPNNIMQRVQEVKFARERMLYDEESDTEMGSVMNSARTLGDSRAPSRQGSFLMRDGKNILRQNSLVSQTIEEQRRDSDALPTILIEGEEFDEKAIMLEKNDCNKQSANGHVVRSHSLVDKLKHEVNGGTTLNGSLPNGLAPIQLRSPMSRLIPNGGDNACRSVSYNQIWDKHSKPRRRWPEGIDKTDYARPLYRKDIFYSGSVLQIPEFNSQPDVKTYIKSVTSIPTSVAPEKESCIWSCVRVPKAAKDILKEMLDISLLSDPVFLVAVIANAFGMLGMYVPFIFVADRAISLGVEQNQAAFLLSVIGENCLGLSAADICSGP